LKTQVITICSLGHSAVWKLTSSLLPEYVRADEYLVFVPEDEVLEFEKITNPRIVVRSQNELGAHYSKELWCRISEKQNEIRFGWYLQQFYKIEALLQSEAELLVIWDADCVPVRSIKVFDEHGSPVYMTGAHEYNPAYFEAIGRLMNLNRVQEMSFVIPGFPIPKSWVQEFEIFLTVKHKGKTWFDAIMDTTDFSLKSGFSETETLGTFVANMHSAEWSTFTGKWERRGQKRFGYARKFSPKKIVKVARRFELDIVSFENWDTRGIRLVMRRLSEKWQKLRLGWAQVDKHQ